MNYSRRFSLTHRSRRVKCAAARETHENGECCSATDEGKKRVRRAKTMREF